MEHIAEAAAEIAFQKCQDLWENSGNGGEWPFDPEKSKNRFDHKKRSNPVLGAGERDWTTLLAVTGWLLVLLVTVLGIWILLRQRKPIPTSCSSPTSDAERKALAQQQLAELRVRRHVTGK